VWAAHIHISESSCGAIPAWHDGFAFPAYTSFRLHGLKSLIHLIFLEKHPSKFTGTPVAQAIGPWKDPIRRGREVKRGARRGFVKFHDH